MKKISRFFQYIKFYNEPSGKTLRTEAFEAAKRYYATRPLRSAENPFPHPAQYSFRREEFVAFQRGYQNSFRHSYAKAKLELTK